MSIIDTDKLVSQVAALTDGPEKAAAVQHLTGALDHLGAVYTWLNASKDRDARAEETEKIRVSEGRRAARAAIDAETERKRLADEAKQAAKVRR